MLDAEVAAMAGAITVGNEDMRLDAEPAAASILAAELGVTNNHTRLTATVSDTADLKRTVSCLTMRMASSHLVMASKTLHR